MWEYMIWIMWNCQHLNSKVVPWISSKGLIRFVTLHFQPTTSCSCHAAGILSHTEPFCSEGLEVRYVWQETPVRDSWTTATDKTSKHSDPEPFLKPVRKTWWGLRCLSFQCVMVKEVQIRDCPETLLKLINIKVYLTINRINIIQCFQLHFITSHRLGRGACRSVWFLYSVHQKTAMFWVQSNEVTQSRSSCASTQTPPENHQTFISTNAWIRFLFRR